MCNLRERGETNLIVLHVAPRFNPWLFIISAKSKITFQRHSQIMWPEAYGSRKFHGNFCANNFGKAAKLRYFLRFQNGSRNMFVNTSKRNWSFIYLIMLSKHLHMGWEFQGTLKSSIFFHFITYFHVLDIFHASCLRRAIITLVKKKKLRGICDKIIHSLENTYIYIDTAQVIFAIYSSFYYPLFYPIIL